MIDIQKKEDTYQFKGQLFFPDIQGPIPFDTGEYIVSLSKYGGFYNPKYGLFFFISDFSPAFLNTLSQGAIDILPQDIT
ncbi:MAG: hypothetical protein U9Q15_01260 [Patescibacteria group bacterium]|nr:hypothetical protein [Patescibacteria group bacterium]